MSDVASLCHICGKPATHTCKMCGRAACDTHYDPASGLCSSCRSRGRTAKGRTL